jgi:hypothetical protein
MLVAYPWTPKGHNPVKMSQAEYTQRVIGSLRRLVRDAAYNAAMVQAADQPKDCWYSRTMALYHSACSELKQFDSRADEFIANTWHVETGGRVVQGPRNDEAVV